MRVVAVAVAATFYCMVFMMMRVAARLPARATMGTLLCLRLLLNEIVRQQRTTLVNFHNQPEVAGADGRRHVQRRS